MPMYPGQRRPLTRPEERSSGLIISTKMWVWLGLLIIVPTLILLAKIGPMRAWAQWSQREPEIKLDITDAIEIYMRKQMPPPPPGVILHERNLPKLHTLILDEPIMPLTFPATIDFQGKATMGDVRGVYHTADRKIIATVGSAQIKARAGATGIVFDP